MHHVADWVTISALATAGGTLALAGATYAAVRSSNRSARVAELALREQRRPVLVHSRDEDPPQPAGFVDGRWAHIPGGGAMLETGDGAVYAAASLRNVGTGIAVMQGWLPTEIEGAEPGSILAFQQSVATADPPDAFGFRPLKRDQYIAPGDVGVWQGTIRDAADPWFDKLVVAAGERRGVSIYLLYTDQIGDQRTISHFALLPSADDDHWIVAASRHWYLDAPGPR